MSFKSKKTGNLKQGNLFSFFSKKPKTTTTTTTTTPATPASSIPKSSDTTPISQSPVSPSPLPATDAVSEHKDSQDLWKKILVGSQISVFWPDDSKYYPATVSKQRGSSSTFFLQYQDGESEWLDLSTEDFKIVNSTSKAVATQKRRRIDESDDEEEHEWQEESSDEDDDDGSVYDPKSAPKEEEEDDEEEESKWMVTDDEDEVVSRPAKKKAKKASSLKVTRHHAGSSTPTTSSPKTTTATTSSFKTPLRQFANTVSPQTSLSAQKLKTTPSTTKSATSTASPPNPRSEISPTASKAASSNAVGDNKKPLPYTKGVVNPAGSHVHNHLKFLRDPKDDKGRRPGEAGYDPRTLQVRESDWTQHVGKMTNAVRQWWDLKKMYFDTVLLFKTGKFYEMFHMDADVGVQHCNLIYMKGHVAHAGFPEIAYGEKADKLVRAGYKVARVEQTETPAMLAERKKRTTKGKKPQVVNREVCSIMTLGTRTFCALDDASALESDGSGGCGPLLAIREVLMDPMEIDATSNREDEDEEGQVQPVCEYGITLVDAVRATVTIGQFADDVLRSRMNTLLTAFNPSEILIQGGDEGASPILHSLIKSYQTSSRTNSRVETINSAEAYPKSTALDPNHRRELQRKTSHVNPWDVQETMDELHRRGYYPKGSRMAENASTSRWPKVLQAVVEGQADLCLSSFGAALFYLQRNLIDREILSMGIVKAYVPPASSCISECSSPMDVLAEQTQQQEDNLEANPLRNLDQVSNAESQIKNMSLDGTTLHNLEILTNSVDHKVSGSLWSKINYTKTPHGARMLRAWLLRPLFRKADIERRADAVQDLVAGGGAAALHEARKEVLCKIGDLDRLLSRVHTMSGTADEDGTAYHPSERAVLYESATYTKKKASDFSKLLHGLRRACQIPELFDGLELTQEGLLHKIVRLKKDGGCFPDMEEELDWFFDHFDCDKASKGLFEPTRGIDQAYDDACDAVERIKAELEDYKQDMCNQISPRHVVKSSWKYINTKPDSKDKYLIELPSSVHVPDDFLVLGKRGKGHKQINKYRTSFVGQRVHQLEEAFEVQSLRKAKGMQLIFAKFDSKRSLWAAAAQATGLLDALGSLAKTAGKTGFCRPTILECPPDKEPSINIVQGRHPCVETSTRSEFIPNDLSLGRTSEEDSSRLLLLSGPNMGGKSTLLRQTCLIAILAQIGSYVPAESCEVTPIDCIYTRLGASDRILLGQSTFFVELAETAAALRGATRRSLVIMDELGRGTSTFDGTAIAGASVKHLVERSRCLSLFATHYHSLLDEWKNEPKVRLGHMQCLVEDESDDGADSSITFLYTLGPGTCPKSFGINVARLASLPAEVLSNAKKVSEEFEEEMKFAQQERTAASIAMKKKKIMEAIQKGNWEELLQFWQEFKK